MGWLVGGFAACAVADLVNFFAWRDDPPVDPRFEPLRRLAGFRAIALSTFLFVMAILALVEEL